MHSTPIQKPARGHHALLFLFTICLSSLPSASLPVTIYLFLFMTGFYSPTSASHRRLQSSGEHIETHRLTFQGMCWTNVSQYRCAQGPFDHDPLNGLIPCPLPQGLAVIRLISKMLKHGGLFLHRRRFFPLGEHRVEVDHCTGRSAQRLGVPCQHETFSPPRL